MAEVKTMVLDRDRVECIARELTQALKNQDYSQFEIRLTGFGGGEATMVVIPRVRPIEIIL